MQVDHPPRLLFHVQHMLGIGHRVRAERIAAACLVAGLEVTLMEGGVPGQIPEGDLAEGADRVQLPPAKSSDAVFSDVVDAETGAPIDETWRSKRASASMAILERTRPDVLLLESFPFARRAFRFELLPLVQRAKQLQARTVVSVRDILVARPNRQKTVEIAETARNLFDVVLVHGDPGFAQLADSFTAAAVLADKIRYTGIVSPDRPDPTGTATGDVVVSAGGGATGGAVIRAALAARPLSRLSDRRWHFLIGPNLPAEDRSVLDHAPAGVLAEPARSDFTQLLARAAVSISQAGYNTVADLAVSGCPAVLVPFEGPTGQEAEQPARARLMASSGHAICIAEPNLTPDRLAAAVDLATEISRDRPPLYRTGGAAVSAEILLALARSVQP